MSSECSPLKKMKEYIYYLVLGMPVGWFLSAWIGALIERKRNNERLCGAVLLWMKDYEHLDLRGLDDKILKVDLSHTNNLLSLDIRNSSVISSEND